MSSPSPLVEHFNPQGRAPVLLLCDHAGKVVPEGPDFLGITEEELSRHIGWDIGAAEVTRELARLLDAPAILDHASRLLIDPNRRPYTPSSIPEVVDGTEIPGNRHLPLPEIHRRIRAYWLPYHRAVARAIGALRRRGTVPAIVSVHSFTPRMNGSFRPWQIGVLWRGDRRLAGPALEALTRRGDLVVGDNEPYSGLDAFGHTIEFHAQRPRLPHVMLELRQSEIASTEGARRFARIVAEALREPLADPQLYCLYPGDHLARLREEHTLERIGWRHVARLSHWA
jgi:predicted N-formylglutamate amidohydrolase